MIVTTHGDEPLVIALTVLYEDELDGRVIAHLPQVLGAIARGADRAHARAAVRGVLCQLIVSYLEPVDVLDRLLDPEPLRLVIEP
ncbi:MAG: hypothetical protein QOC78_271 [Solirubrobacteraceae bacterium]|jgi:hypothetical protein|nr:hypothetical protein [Solirubrobacteraceae bacterium]